MHRVIIFKEKDGLRVYALDFEDSPNVVARRILSERIEEGWYDGTDGERARKALTKGSAYDFLLERCRRGCEYETFELYDPIDARLES
jgi:hypothetical protein